MRTLWEARFLDGRTAARRNVTVQLTRTGLGFSLSDGRAFWWPYAEIRQTQGGYVGEPVRLEHGSPPEVLVIDTPSFLSAVHQIAPDAPFHNPGTRRRRVLLALVALGALCALLGGA